MVLVSRVLLVVPNVSHRSPSPEGHVCPCHPHVTGSARGDGGPRMLCAAALILTMVFGAVVRSGQIEVAFLPWK